MAQDNVNEPTVAEEPEISDQSQVGDPAGAQATTESQIAEPAMDDSEDDVAEEEADEEGEDETTETGSPSKDDTADAASSSSATLPTQSTAEADERSDLEKQPYDFDHCTVQIAIQLLPDDGDPNGRMVVGGVRSHLDVPILRLVRLNEIGALPPLVATLLDELKVELPAREQAAREAFEKKKEEKAKHKSAVTASKTARGKKTKATLSTAPASSSTTTTDNRPRPEIQATTAHQQQMGLF
jgi:hypothetical protein